MPVLLINENYNGQSFLQANAGDWIDASVEISMRFSKGSGVSNKVTYNGSGGIYRLTFQSGDWADEGFMVGDTIVITYQWYNNPPPFQAQTFTAVVTYINGSQMQIDQPFGVTTPSFSTHVDGRQFPTDGLCSGLLIVSTRVPENIDFLFNLTPSGTALLNSVIDSELNRFEVPTLNTIGVGGSLPMIPLANRSGGYITEPVITYTYSEGSPTYWRRYRVDFKFWQWGVIKDGYTTDNPPYYDTADCLAPCSRFKIFPQYGNPNGVLQITNETLQANTGGFNENLNGGLSAYTWLDTNFFDYLGNPISAVDYSNECTFVATIDAPDQNNPLSTYRIGMVWRPIDGSFYQNIVATDLGENLMVLSPEIDFIADGTTDPTVYQGETHPTGARWDFTDLKFELTGVNELTVSGKIIPNAQANTLFAGVPDGGRKTTIWVSIGNYNNDGTTLSERVSLKIFDTDNYDAPTLGVQIPNVIDQVLIDHGFNDITVPLPQTTTEDDVLFRSHFRLIDGVDYEGVRARIYAYNTVNEEEFTLEDIFFSFAGVVNIGGQFQPNFLTNRGFNLPPTTDRNHISLTREPLLDIAGQYALKLEYGWLNDWRYWLEQANVNNDFFDILEQWDGKNKNWQRFSNSGDWLIRLSYYTRLAGVDDFNHQEVGIRPYEDDPDVTTDWAIQVLSTGATPSNLVNDELHEITATLTWATGAYTNPWAELTVEDFEGGNRWVISSVLAQGGIASNPLQPISGATGLDISFPSVNIAELKCLVDTSLISSNKICMSARIYSEDKPIPPEWEFLINNEKDAVGAYSVARKLSPDSIYSGPLIRVRRGLDNAEQDIPYIQIGSEFVLDEDALLAFTGDQTDDWGWVVTRYDQTEENNHATALSLSDQAPIVKDGVVYKDPISNRPAMLCDGVNHHARITAGSGIANTNEMLTVSVFNRLLDETTCVGFGSHSDNFPFSMLWSGTFNLIYSGFGDLPPNNVHFTGASQSGSFINVAWRDNAGNNRMRLNGVLGTVVSDASIIAIRHDSIERTNTNFHEGYKSEDVIYQSDRDETEIWIENNVNNFYSIF